MRVEFARVAIKDVGGVYDFGKWNSLYEAIDQDRLWCDGDFAGDMLETLFFIQPVVIVKRGTAVRVVAGVQSWMIYSQRCGPEDMIPVIKISGLGDAALTDLIFADVILRMCLGVRKGHTLGLLGRLWRQAESHINTSAIWRLISRKKFSLWVLASHLGTSTTALSKGGEHENR
ncbi:MAG: hypothetical protein HZB57_05825 [Gammaproteobacteria bacterium]|nr:hypothetical protein [Gammaproteobacteria bacterium]